MHILSNNGYTLAGLIVALAALMIGMMVAVPLWSTAIQREKEKELIFRGEQYAMAIEEYKAKTGADLLELEALIKVEPRVIRKLWTDPMTGKNDWRLIHRGELMAQNRQGIPGLTDSDENTETKTETGLSEPSASVTVNLGGPIIGVASSCEDKSIMIYKDKTKYSEWLFTVNDLQQKRAMILGQPQQGVPAPGLPADGDDPNLRPGPGGDGPGGGPGGGMKTIDK